MPEKVKTITVENLKELTNEEFKEYSSLVTSEYYRRLKEKGLAWWDKTKVGGTRARNVLICIACLEAIVWLGKEILK